MKITDGGNLVSVHDRKTAKFLSNFIRNIEWNKPPWDRSGVWTGGIMKTALHCSACSIQSCYLLLHAAN